MAKAPVVEDAQMRHALKVAAVTGQTPARDVALLCVLYGTGVTATELAQLEVADILCEGGDYRRESEVRPSIAFNGRRRIVFWTNTRVREALDAYSPSGFAFSTGSQLGARSGADWCTLALSFSRTTADHSP